LLRLLWDLCRFRRGPQDLPYSPALARGLVLADAGAGLLYLQIVGAGKGGVAQLAVAMLIAVLAPLILLRSRGLGERYVQTLSALVGTGALLTLVYLPVGVLAADMPAPDINAEPTRQQLAVAWLTLTLVAWKLTINGHIWRHSMNWPLAAGIALALGIFVVEIGLLRLLFGA
jgi:hypothetical protein